MADQIKHASANPITADLRRRSKGGCIDCKTAKVRCDEVRPSCGTCARRQRRCRGYHTLPSASTEREQKFIFYRPTERRRQTSNISDAQLNVQVPVSTSTDLETVGEGNSEPRSIGSSMSLQRYTVPVLHQPEAFGFSKSRTLQLTTSDGSTTPFPPIIQPFPMFPPVEIPSDDAQTISLYFNRHPFEQVISLEFVDEMNASTWMVFQDSPKAVSDALCSIGSVYLEEDSQNTSLSLALVKRAKTLAALKIKDPSRELEQMLLMSLALGAMEGIDTKCQPHERTSSILIAYVVSIINRYLESGLVLSSLAKYFIRALARHDTIISLSQLRRNLIRTNIWFDETAHQPDRFMGYTTTLMPLLEELCGLAEDIHRNPPHIQAIDHSLLITYKVDDLRSRIQGWRWNFPKGVSAASTERLMAHARAYRAAALLMLFRLQHTAGSSSENDQAASKMAMDVMVHLTRPPEDLKLSTWPALIASCEMQSEQDRFVATNVFWSIYSVRKTGTSLQTLKFVTDRVWRARDEGIDWDWMALSQQFPGECVPI